MNAKIASKPLCCISIGYKNYLLPSDKGMKLVELMQNALECEIRFEGEDFVYFLKDHPTVEFRTVKPDQIKRPAGDKFEPAPTRRVGLSQVLLK